MATNKQARAMCDVCGFVYAELADFDLSAESEEDVWVSEVAERGRGKFSYAVL